MKTERNNEDKMLKTEYLFVLNMSKYKKKNSCKLLNVSFKVKNMSPSAVNTSI